VTYTLLLEQVTFAQQKPVINAGFSINQQGFRGDVKPEQKMAHFTRRAPEKSSVKGTAKGGLMAVSLLQILSLKKQNGPTLGPFCE